MGKKGTEEGKAKRMKNIADKKFGDLPPEKQKEICSMGGKASGEAKRRRKTFLEIMNWLGECRASDAEIKNFQNIFPGVKEKDLTKDIMVAAGQYYKAINKQDTFAAAFIRDTKGEKPDTKVSGSITTEKIFISKEEKEATLDHIQKVIQDGNQ